MSRIDEHRRNHNVLAASHHFPFNNIVIARIGVVLRVVLVHYLSINASILTGTTANADASNPILPHSDRNRRCSVGIPAIRGQHPRSLRGLEDVVGLQHAVEERGEESERRRGGNEVAPLDDRVQRGASERVDGEIEARRGVSADFPGYRSGLGSDKPKKAESTLRTDA